MRSDVNFQISRAGLSHPAQVLTNQIACFAVVIIQYVLLHKLIIPSPSHSTLNNPGVLLSYLACSTVFVQGNQLHLSFSNSCIISGLTKSSRLSQVIAI